MANDYVAILDDLDRRLVKGTILETDYNRLKWKMLTELHNSGALLDEVPVVLAEPEITDRTGATYCHIPKGPFLFGPDNIFAVVKAPFYIGKYPVTVAEFRVFLKETNYDYPKEDLDQLELVSPEPNCPVSHVSWKDALAYCGWMRKATHEFYYLPSETEWELATRGFDGRYYPWGYDDPSHDRACYQSDEITPGNTTPVDAYPDNVSPFGCVGMAGNVWEWCRDCYDDERDPHTLRGGSWCNPGVFLTCYASTFSFPAKRRIDYGGFRIIYLPGDKLVEYQQVVGDVTANVTKAEALEVVGLTDTDREASKVVDEREPSVAEQKDMLSTFSIAIDLASARAAGEQADALDDVTADIDADIARIDKAREQRMVSTTILPMIEADAAPHVPDPAAADPAAPMSKDEWKRTQLLKRPKRKPATPDADNVSPQVATRAETDAGDTGKTGQAIEETTSKPAATARNAMADAIALVAEQHLAKEKIHHENLVEHLATAESGSLSASALLSDTEAGRLKSAIEARKMKTPMSPAAVNAAVGTSLLVWSLLFATILVSIAYRLGFSGTGE